AALVAAGAVPFSEGVRVVLERGRLMVEACVRVPSTVDAVLGVEPDVLREICARTGAALCNFNAPGNITIGGTVAAVEAASAAATEAGASRVVPLTVAGAFHTPLMQSAADGMRAVLAAVAFRDPGIPVVSNVTAQPITSAAALPEELAAQVVSPVMWVPSVQTMQAAGVSQVIEFGPGRVLTGLVRRIDRAIGIRNVSTAEEARA
ncbi:MAG: ACP S-malonyltransferase, partial [Dehalococcoidia bacterium]|nr:ACP S-malonyltransferase [Dehalococcoidia bacterium]